MHSEEGGLYAANTEIKHTEEYDLYSESGHVNEQRPKHSLCLNKENMIDIYYYNYSSLHNDRSVAKISRM